MPPRPGTGPEPEIQAETCLVFPTTDWAIALSAGAGSPAVLPGMVHYALVLMFRKQLCNLSPVCNANGECQAGILIHDAISATWNHRIPSDIHVDLTHGKYITTVTTVSTSTVKGITDERNQYRYGHLSGTGLVSPVPAHKTGEVDIVHRPKVSQNSEDF